MEITCYNTVSTPTALAPERMRCFSRRYGCPKGVGPAAGTSALDAISTFFPAIWNFAWSSGEAPFRTAFASPAIPSSFPSGSAFCSTGVVIVAKAWDSAAPKDRPRSA